MSDCDILDPRFGSLIVGHAKLERLWTGGRWSEGPVYVPAAKSVLGSDIDAVRVCAPDGTRIGRIRIPEIVSNLCFGGAKRNRLFITAQTSLYAVYANAHPPGW